MSKLSHIRRIPGYIPPTEVRRQKRGLLFWSLPHVHPSSLNTAYKKTLFLRVVSYPKHSMYGILGIFTYMWLFFMVNVGKYTIHWVCGYGFILLSWLVLCWFGFGIQACFFLTRSLLPTVQVTTGLMTSKKSHVEGSDKVSQPRRRRQQQQQHHHHHHHHPLCSNPFCKWFWSGFGYLNTF